VAVKMGVSVDKDFDKDLSQYDNDLLTKGMFLSTDPINLRYCAIMFLKRLQEKNFNAFTWVSYYLHYGENITVVKRKKFINGSARNITGKSDILLWKMLSNVIDPKIHDILISAYYNHSEQRPFLSLAIVVAIYGLKYDNMDLEPGVNMWKTHLTAAELLQGKFILEIDDYVIDKHTGEGRRDGMSTKEFVDEGSKVFPQDIKYYDETLEKIYKTR